MPLAVRSGRLPRLAHELEIAMGLPLTYAQRRRLLLAELRLLRRTHPATRVIKDIQRLMQKLRHDRGMEH